MGCHRAPPNVVATGVATPQEAIATFLSGARAENIKAMETVWGTAEGPAIANHPRPEVEQMLFYNMKCLRNDSYRLLDEPVTVNDQLVFSVVLQRGDVAVTTRVTTALDRAHGKWFVASFDPSPVSQLCSMKS
jgi:hypothetical protein